jgi:hypothetical protein
MSNSILANCPVEVNSQIQAKSEAPTVNRHLFVICGN